MPLHVHLAYRTGSNRGATSNACKHSNFGRFLPHRCAPNLDTCIEPAQRPRFHSQVFDGTDDRSHPRLQGYGVSMAGSGLVDELSTGDFCNTHMGETSQTITTRIELAFEVPNDIPLTASCITP
jgi:hypothetical protein